MTQMFSSVLVANRGEIAVRIIRTLRHLGIRSIAVHSDADAGARHVMDADEAVRIGESPASASYLDVERIITAAVSTGAEAVHPGYGFVSENPALARACAEYGIAFVGPPVDAIHAMGDKIRSKHLVAAAGVPVVPGIDVEDLDGDALIAAIDAVGYPILVKPSAGGGGKGMRLVHDAGSLLAAVAGARREALSSFGDDTLLIERFVESPRHIEIQVLADHHGNVVHLGERECSLQRRHQKIVEEAPSVLLTPERREALGDAAVAAARSCGYTNAGTVEFIMSNIRPDEFFFLEMNTRLQVEHPVTEMVYGIDLVELQLRIAAGEALPFEQSDLVPSGHAVEARVYAEDPAAGFLPTGGQVIALTEPSGPGVRVDSGIVEGAVVGSHYDPMLSKIIAHGPDRTTALRRLDRALAATEILGVTTNIGMLRSLLVDADVVAGRLDTDLVTRRLGELCGAQVPDVVRVAAALGKLDPAAHLADDAWQTTTGWRLGGPSPIAVTVAVGGQGSITVLATFAGVGWVVQVGDGEPLPASLTRHGTHWTVRWGDTTTTFSVAPDGDRTWLGTGGRTWTTRIEPAWEQRLTADDDGGHGPVRSPMPGRVTAIAVAAGDVVEADQMLATVEAMKMEYALRATVAGVVTEIHCPIGTQVRLDDPVVTVSAQE